MKTILVVDDEYDFTHLCAIIFGRHGLTVHAAYTGVEALEKITSIRPDAVLLDVMMPLMSGFEVLEALREDPQTRHIPIIMMSAVPSINYSGPHRWNAFLRKPFRFEDAVKTITDIIGRP
jgi:CheY-like chemotaxis protein